MEAAIQSGNFRMPVSLVSSSIPCTADWERNHQESQSRPRPTRSVPSTSCPNRQTTRQSDLLSKLNRLNTEQLTIALHAADQAEEQQKMKKKNNNIRQCNTERRHGNSSVTNASADQHSDLLTKLSGLNAERLSIALRAVAQAEREKKKKKKNNNNNNRQRTTERRHGNSSLTNASADRQPTAPCLQPLLRADAPPWSPTTDISKRTDEIDAPILRTVTFEEEESTHSRAGTSDALPDSTHARNTTTDDAEDRIAQLAQSIETELNGELAKIIELATKICTTLEHTTDPECELNDCNVPTDELLLQLSQPAFTLHHPTCKPGDPPDPESPRAEPSHPSLHNFPAGLAEDIVSFSRHNLRPTFANDTRHRDLTGSAPICPASEPTGSSLQDHDGDDDNATPPTTSTTKLTADEDFIQVGGPQRIEYTNAPTIGENNIHHTTCSESGPQESHGPLARNRRRNTLRRARRKAVRPNRQQIGTSGEDNTQNLASSESKPQDSHGPQARNHRRNIRRRNKRKAARLGSQAQKKTHAMSSGRANNRVQLFTKKTSKSSGIGIYLTGCTVLPEEKVNAHFRDEQHNRRAIYARKKTYVKSSGKAGNQDKLRKKKADQSSGMGTYYSGSTHTTEESIHKSFGTNYVLQLLDNALYQTGSSLHQIPPRVYYAGSTVLPEERSKSLRV